MDTSSNPFPSADEITRSLAGLPARPTVCVQGLGFVGAAMAVAVADASDPEGRPLFNVVGVDLATAEGTAKIAAINSGRVPMPATDRKLAEALARAHARGNLVATADPAVFRLASVVVVSVPLDVVWDGSDPTMPLEPFRRAIRTLGRHLSPGSLVVVETTVPPGTTENVAVPELAAALEERGLQPGAVHVAHSSERVMPGDAYLDSIVNFWRVYAGATPEAADACEEFLLKVVNVEQYPLTRLHSTTASETAKVLENSYRATTIALMEEWGRFAEAIGVDLFQVIEAIRLRPTHSNMRQPGFGVGGYCLTKDSLLARIAARDFYELELDFPFSTLAVSVNESMPLVSLDRLAGILDGSLAGKNILLLGVSYRPDVGDTRYSPSELFVSRARERGAAVTCHDPLVVDWPELGMTIPSAIPPAEAFDAVVFAVPHSAYARMDLAGWLGTSRPVVLDATNVLTRVQRAELRALGCRVESVGRGERL